MKTFREICVACGDTIKIETDFAHEPYKIGVSMHSWCKTKPFILQDHEDNFANENTVQRGEDERTSESKTRT